MSEQVLSDVELVAQAREGNTKAFDVLVLRYQERAILIACSVLRDFELAKDASQNGFAKAYFALNRFRGDAQFKTWLFRIILNEAKDAYRREKSRGIFKWRQTEEKEGGESGSIFETIPSETASPRESYEREEMKKIMERAVYELPERERDVFMLRYFHECSLTEVAETLGIAVGTVKAHLSQGSEKLKVILTRRKTLSRFGKKPEGEI